MLHGSTSCNVKLIFYSFDCNNETKNDIGTAQSYLKLFSEVTKSKIYLKKKTDAAVQSSHSKMLEPSDNPIKLNLLKEF